MLVTCPANLISLDIIIRIIPSKIQGLILMRWVGSYRIHLVRQPRVGPLDQAGTMDEYEPLGEIGTGRENWSILRTSVPVPLSPSESHMTPTGIEPVTTRRYNPGDRTPHSHRCENPKFNTACLRVQNFRGCVRSCVGSLHQDRQCGDIGSETSKFLMAIQRSATLSDDDATSKLFNTETSQIKQNTYRWERRYVLFYLLFCID
jgi:hypothetical protein